MMAEALVKDGSLRASWPSSLSLDLPVQEVQASIWPVTCKNSQLVRHESGHFQQQRLSLAAPLAGRRARLSARGEMGVIGRFDARDAPAPPIRLGEARVRDASTKRISTC
jgi:hypothetical protein